MLNEIIAVTAAAFIIVILFIIHFMSFKQWLLYAVSEAEQYFGSGTGQLKLQYVYNLAVEGKFSFIAKIITFNMFSNFVDIALEKMKNMIENNDAIANIFLRKKAIDDKFE